MAMVDSTSFDAALKLYYTDEYVRNLVYEENPLFAMLSKLESWTGKNYNQPVQYGIASASRSASITKALSRKATNRYKDFVITSSDDYNAISIGRKVMKQSGNNRGAFFQAQTREIDGMLQTLINSCSHALYRGGGGAIGQLSTAAPSTVNFTLAEIEDVVFFEEGLVLQSSDNSGDASTDTLHSLTDVGVVSAVNRDTGVITSATNWATQMPNLGANDFVFPDGDFQAKIKGLGAWCPASAPGGSDSFFGVNRSVDTSRLAGQRVTGNTSTIREALRKAASRLGREGQSADCVFMSYQKYNDLVTELDNKVQYIETGTEVDVGFTGIRIVGNKKPIDIYPDHNCPDGRAFMFMMNDWKLISYGPVPDLHDEDGNRMLREGNADGFEVRASYYAALTTANTAAIANITLE